MTSDAEPVTESTESKSPDATTANLVQTSWLMTALVLHLKEANRNPGPYIYRHPQVPLDVEAYPVAPAGLELEQVHVFVRHGERAPVGVRLANPPANIPPHWIMCQTARRFQATVARTTHMSSIVKDWNKLHQTAKVLERKDGMAVEGECLLGELTDVGKQSTYNFGVGLRELYVNKLGFIPNILKDDHSVYFRSTKVPRTIESLLQIMQGLYPEEKCHSHARPVLLVRNPKDENLVGNSYCKRLEMLLTGFAMAAANTYNPVLKNLDKHVSKYFNGKSICVDGKPKASGVMDTIRAAIAHGIKVPPEFEDKNIVDPIEEAVVQEWFSDKTEEVRRLAMGRLLDDLTSKMHRKMERGHGDPLKILVHSTHDAAIAGLCTTFDVSEEKWPAFTSSITFELFKRRSRPESHPPIHQGLPTRSNSDTSPTDYYIRMRFQNQNMVLPICAEKGKHLEGAPEFCTFKAFNDRVKELVPEDWEAECMPSGRVARS